MRNESKKNEKKGKKDRKGGERKIKRGWEKSEALISAKRRYIFDIFKNKIRADEREKRERKREEKKRREKEKRERERRKNKGEKRKKKEKAIYSVKMVIYKGTVERSEEERDLHCVFEQGQNKRHERRGNRRVHESPCE